MNRSLRIVALISIIGLLLACNDGMTESQHLTKSREFKDKGQFNAASIELKNALQKSPDNPEARLELGKLYLEMGDMAAAEKELSRAADLGAKPDIIMPFLGRSLLYQGKHADVMDLSLKGLNDEAKAEILALKGLSLVAQGDLDKARFLIDKAMATNKQSIHAMVANAGLLGYNNQYAKSKAQLDSVFKVDPDFAPAWSLLGDIELSQDKYQPALEAYSKAISLRINNMSDMLKRTMILIQQKKYDEAQKDISYLKERIPLHPGFNYAQGVIHFHNKNIQDAQAAFDLALVDEKRYPLALYYAGLTNFLLGQRERAEKYATQYHTRFPDHPPAGKLLAIVQLSRSQYKQAEELLRPMVEANQNDVGALNLLASALLRQGKSDESIELLSRVVALNPDSPQAQMRLGMGLMIGGDDAAGEEHIAAAAKMDKSNKRGEILLILNYMRQKQFDRAIEKANAYKEQYPSEASSFNILGRVQQLIGKKQEAIDSFQNALKLEPGDPSASQNLAAMAIDEKDFSKARDYYLKALENHDNHLVILLRLAALDSIQRNKESMVKYLQQAIESHPKAVEPRLVLARFYLSEGKSEQVAVLVGKFDKTQMRTPSVLELMSLSQLAKGDFVEARNTLEQFIQLQPRSAVAHHWLANAFEGQNKPKQMRTALEKSIELAPEYLPARLALARHLLRTGENELAAEHMAVLKKRAPDHPEVMQLEAAEALTAGNTKLALELAESVYQKAPTTRNMLTLARVRWNLDNRDGSVQLQTDWVKEHPTDIDARLALASNYLILGKEETSVEQYQKVLDNDENNLIALNNLAWFLREKEPRKALSYARLAVEKQPRSAPLMDTLAVVLLENKEITEAETVIKRAMVKDPKNPAIQYHGAMILAASGNSAEAVRVLEKLKNSGVKYQEQKDAEALLNRLQASK
jgi:putative PEP-CTERM system TPR-repeat lipoprotein